MKKIITILALLALGGCATSEKKKQHNLLYIADKYAAKSPTIKDLKEKDFC
jgi:uncharacterized lipoprotein YmbA